MSASTDLCDLGIALRQLDLSSRFENLWAPMTPAPKPIPKPQPLPITPSQATKQQAQQHQQLAQHLHRAITQSDAQQRIYPQPPAPLKPLPLPHRAHDQWLLGERQGRAGHALSCPAPIQNRRSDKKCVSSQKRGFRSQIT